MTVRGKVKNGKVLLDDPGAIPEGTEVEVRPAKENKSVTKSHKAKEKNRLRSAVGLDSIQLAVFEHAGVRYNLRKPMIINVGFADGHWIYSNESINLWGYGARRQDALQDLHENFAYLWKEIAEEKDELLDAKARNIKRRLIDFRDSGE